MLRRPGTAPKNGRMPPRVLPAGFVPPCLPTKAHRPPLWLAVAARNQARRLPGHRPQGRTRGSSSTAGQATISTGRCPLIVEALARLRSRSCILDGEAVACDDNGVASFDRIRHHRVDASVFLYAFDLIELNGDDLRRDPLDVRKATLTSVVAKAGAGIRFNEHLGPR